MLIAGGKLDNGIAIGNTYNKYGSQNPIVKHLMNGFDASLSRLVNAASPKSIHEVGCGEGYWALQWLSAGINVRGSDFSADVIELAKANASSAAVDPGRFHVKSIYDLDPAIDSADLIVCCEVLEHLEEPELALQTLSRLGGKDLIISVPREPLWRMLNMLRGKYITQLGNTPGHLQHWSKSGISSLVGNYFEIQQVLSPIPWTMLHCKWK
ncbi:MAG: class I SAM-dependent methyltransferase [Rhizobiaceae bacterium]|nr:class I SAM-dependent methyltransferase [Rhizobiaceae bacterium]